MRNWVGALVLLLAAAIAAGATAAGKSAVRDGASPQSLPRVKKLDFAGGAFDPATNRVFLIETNGENPIVHVLSIARA